MQNITVIGGGTGSYTVLKGLSKLNKFKLYAIVTTMDDGGSTGILRDELGILPPGDARQCLVAMSKSSNLMRELLMYRFDSGTLQGHNFGNILIAALTKITGSFTEAIRQSGQLFNISGRVIPVTIAKSTLFAELENHQIIEGELNIAEPKHNPELKINKVFLNPEVEANPQALKAIRNSDIIIFCPGNLYSSVIPNLLVNGIKEAIKNSKAKKVYFPNLMTKHGQTNNLNVKEHVDLLESYIENKIDKIIINCKQPNEQILELYEKQQETYVKDNFEDTRKISADIISEEIIPQKTNDKVKRSLIRHDSDKIALIISKLTE
jgi:uncharacterized cofD-like protein